MDSIFLSGGVVGAPAVPSGSATNPSDGNPGTATLPSTPGAYWYYQITQELLAVINGAGITPSKNTLTQLRDAIKLITVQPGMFGLFAYNSTPTDWLKCNGAAVSRVTYAALYAKIGTVWGVGDGSTTFNVPEFRAQFMRGFDDGRGVDSGRVFGAAQSGQVESHQHIIWGEGAAAGSAVRAMGPTSNAPYNSVTQGYGGGSETRPSNNTVMICIKY